MTKAEADIQNDLTLLRDTLGALNRQANAIETSINQAGHDLRNLRSAILGTLDSLDKLEQDIGNNRPP